ncbi:hypothetical protein CVT25_007613 [Psilocybe cyanescens]|uniref:Uncharacterized protein n=1 Tax=Psilocybe cyanescens TaxID=93625 RepID=A0A409X193_PSICY|nr:hypothetical protein CVT25_007613 [Psilocybe cyanescens]
MADVNDSSNTPGKCHLCLFKGFSDPQRSYIHTVSGAFSSWDAHLPPLQDEDEDSGEELAGLETLARVLHILDIPDASFASYSTAIDTLNTEKYTLLRSLNRLKQVEDELNDHLDSLKHEHGLITRWNKVLTPGTQDSLYPETTATLEKRREAVIKKAKEHHREFEFLLADVPLKLPTVDGTPVTIGRLLAQKETNQAQEREIKEKRTRIKAFQGLPPNLELARHELRQARQRQTELIQLRERLLAKMADGVA